MELALLKLLNFNAYINTDGYHESLRAIEPPRFRTLGGTELAMKVALKPWAHALAAVAAERAKRRATRLSAQTRSPQPAVPIVGEGRGVAEYPLMKPSRSTAPSRIM